MAKPTPEPARRGMDPLIAQHINASILTHLTESLALTSMADRNAVQGLTVINTHLIQQQGSVSDDAGLIAALQAVAGAPMQGDHARKSA